MIDKKGAAIIVLLALLVIAGFGWLSSVQISPQENENNLPIPYDNTYSWTEIFQGYEAYLDRRISYSPISGTSMEPTFGEEDVIIWVGVENKAELKVGDIIVFPHPTKPDQPSMAHRIVEVRVQDGVYSFRTQGDNMPNPDLQWVYGVRGIVIGVVYNAGPG